MRINAYLLAADPTWIEHSICSYYDLVGKIFVSYDETGRGWTGSPVNSEQCLHRLRAVDTQKKMRFLPGSYTGNKQSPINGDTRQRQEALDAASEEADWVLQLDTDEVLPNPLLLASMLDKAAAAGFAAVEWPMRVLFRRLTSGKYLEVCAKTGEDRFEYPGPVAVQPGTTLVDARRARGPFLRLCARGDKNSLQIVQAPQAEETRWECLDSQDAIIHNSWARDARSIRSKIASWGHNEGYKTWLFYYLRWKPAPVLWFLMRDFHPLYPSLWPALKTCVALPEKLAS